MIEKYWLISENVSGNTYYYTGYFEAGIPVFNMAIADAVHIASFASAKALYDFLIQAMPCEILIVEENSVSKVYPK